MSNVEILVPQRALADVKRALGTLPSTTFHTHLSGRLKPDLVVSSLDLLDTPTGRRALEDFLHAFTTMRIALVFFEAVDFAPTRAAFEALTRLSHQARSEPYIAPDTSAVRRLVLARRSGAEKELVASASIEDGKLVVWSCEPRRFEVPVTEIPVLARMSPDVLEKVEVSTSGSRIRWPEADVDINLDTIREYADPEVRREHEARARQEAARYAKAIRQLREERDLKQADIEGLTERQVRRLEEGSSVPQIETLRKLAAAHGMDVDDYLRELAKRSRSSQRRSARSRQREHVR